MSPEGLASFLWEAMVCWCFELPSDRMDVKDEEEHYSYEFLYNTSKLKALFT